MKYGYRLLAVWLLAGLSLTIAGCGGKKEGPKSGTLEVALTVRPAEGVQSIVLALSEVRIVGVGDESGATSDPPGIVTFNPPRVVDVMSLQFKQLLLGKALVPPGDYSQVRLVLAANIPGQDPVNYVTYTAAPTERVALQSPSGQTAGLKVLGRFGVQAGMVNTIVLDFDPSRSIVKAGENHSLKPTGIRIMQLEQMLATFGALTGKVSPARSRRTAFVSLVPQDLARSLASGTANPETGEFRAVVPPGTYYVRVEALGSNTYDGSELVTPRVFVVKADQDTAAGEFKLSASN
ncbi:MAG: DUF4382 domain-containing protein [Armatimonadota bacterium]